MKVALDVLTTALAKERGPCGVTVNAVNPGAIDTDLNTSWLRGDEVAYADVAARSPLNRVETPDDVAGGVAFLVWPDAGWVTGQTLDATVGAPLSVIAGGDSGRRELGQT